MAVATVRMLVGFDVMVRAEAAGLVTDGGIEAALQRCGGNTCNAALAYEEELEEKLGGGQPTPTPSKQALPPSPPLLTRKAPPPIKRSAESPSKPPSAWATSVAATAAALSSQSTADEKPSVVARKASAKLAYVETALRPMFELLDVDGDGTCTRAELIEGLRNDANLQSLLGLPSYEESGEASRAAFEAAFADIDQDGDDQITLIEFRNFVMVQASIASRLNTLKHNGYLSPHDREWGHESSVDQGDEMFDSAAQRQGALRASARLAFIEEALRPLFMRLDVDYSGECTRAELIKGLRNDAKLLKLLGLPSYEEGGENSRAAFEAAFADMDRDGNDGISLIEFRNFVVARSAKAVRLAKGKQKVKRVMAASTVASFLSGGVAASSTALATPTAAEQGTPEHVQRGRRQVYSLLNSSLLTAAQSADLIQNADVDAALLASDGNVTTAVITFSDALQKKLADENVAPWGFSARSAGGHIEVPPNVRAVFEKLDRNQDGQLTRAELIKALRQDEELQKLLQLPGRVGDSQNFERVFQGE